MTSARAGGSINSSKLSIDRGSIADVDTPLLRSQAGLKAAKR